jgi:filamentous hemagglutinin family protein
LLASSGTVIPAELPVPCLVGSCSSGVQGFVSTGVATATQTGNTLTVDQASANAVLNWRSFNVSSDGTVNFRQPDSSAVALNRIYQGSPSQIFGALNANGRVFLVNQNGVVFGDGAQVNVGGLVASALDISRDAAERGIAVAAQNGAPAFQEFRDPTTGAPLPSGSVVVQRGATVNSRGGQVLMFAPEVVRNDGTIRTPDGQTMLAAGRSVFLTSSTDANLRGLLVEVNDGGSVFNGSSSNVASNVAQIVAERGNVTLAGLAVNQQGRISATTSVRANGSIRLQARDTVSVNTAITPAQITASRGGSLTVGGGSDTRVTLDQSTETAVDVTAQPRSLIELDGRVVQILDGATLTSTAGDIAITARANPAVAPNAFARDADDSRLYIAPGVRLNVSGASVELPIERNVLRVELRGTQLADSPVQRDGVLRGQTAFVDLRRSGTRPDGTRWQGTPLADLAGDVGTIQRDVAERSLNAGAVRLQSQGSLVVDRAATFDLSGGQVRYLDGFINTSQLLADTGRVVDVGDADPTLRYVGIATAGSVDSPRWGITQQFAGPGRDARGVFERGYVEGRDAGTLSLAAPRAVFDANIVGTVVRGPYQRLATQALPSGQLYRSFDQVALAARLVVGIENPLSPDTPNYLVPSVGFGVPPLVGNLRNADGSAFDPRENALPESAQRLVLRPQLFGSGAFGRLAVFANDQIGLSTGTRLALPAGGDLSFNARSIRIAGEIVAPSGSIALRALRTESDNGTDVAAILDGTARLSASGAWVNDDVALTGSRPVDPLFTAGGSVSVQARQGSALLLEGSEVDVSGGLWRRSDGALVAGRGGSVAISATPQVVDVIRPSIVRLDGVLRGHSYGAGGDLSIAASGICVAPRNCASDAFTLPLTPEFLSAGGFGSVRLTSNLFGVDIAPNTEVRLLQRNLALIRDAAFVPSGSSLAAYSVLTTLPDDLRAPVNLTLAANVPAGLSAVDRSRFAELPGLTIGTGAGIFADPLARIALQATSRIEVDGRIVAPGGTISAELTSELNVIDFLPSQAIWLGANGTLDVSGSARLLVNDLGIRSGVVFDGGRVGLRATRGSIVLLPGSIIDVAGVNRELDTRVVQNGVPRFVPTIVGSNGGFVDLQAAESIIASGGFRASGGVGASDGRLRIALDPSARNGSGPTGPIFPVDSRVVRVRDSQSPIALPLRTDLPESLRGTALIAAEQLRSADFGSVTLVARNLFEGSAESPLSIGAVLFDGGVNLSLAQRLVIDSPSIVSNGGVVRVAAPYVALGSFDVASQLPAPVVGTGSGQFFASGSLLELVGATTLNGFASVNLDSTGDIRGRGIQAGDAPAISGSFAVSGDLRMRAQQIYPTTFSQFALSANARAGASLTIESAPGPRASVLSAGGSLELVAPIIRHSGALVAPFGRIAIGATSAPRAGELGTTAEQIEVLAGSLTSTSGAGAIIPFGTIQGGFDWVYELPSRRFSVFDGVSGFLPAQAVNFVAGRVDLGSGATVDVSGGGDLLAYEFVPGVGGTRDILGTELRPNQFAILPSSALPFAPFDTREYLGSSLQPGDSVYLSGTEDLPAGFYALLPARYALLPGAYLVTATTGFAGIANGESFRQLDGSTVIAGYRTFLESGVGANRQLAFSVRPGSTVQREANYQVSLANAFFSRPAAVESPAAATRRPVDAGLLAVAATESLRLGATLRAGTGSGGRGASVDISAENLRIVEDASSAPDDGSVIVDAASVRQLGAQSVLIGGTRSSSASGTTIATTARSVVVDAETRLVAPEIILAASEAVRLTAGSEVAAAGNVFGAEPDRYLLSGDGAFLRASVGPQASIVRTGTSGTAGALTIESGAVVRASGALLLDASADLSANGTLDVRGASLGFSASRINLGSAPATASGLNVDPSRFASLGLAELTLTSRGELSLFGSFTLPVTRLLIDSPAISGQTSGEARFRADYIDLRNSGGGTVPSVAPSGTGSIIFEARQVGLSGGAIAIAGADSVAVSATDQLFATADTELSVAGPLTIRTPRVTAGSGVDFTLTTEDELNLLASAGGASSDTAPALGARIALNGRAVMVDTRVDAIAGEIALHAAGVGATDNVTLGARAVLNASGREEVFDGRSVFVPAGRVSLSSHTGDVIVDENAILDVSAPTRGGDAGDVSIRATRGAVDFAGVLRGAATNGYSAGSFSLDAVSFGDLDTWSRTLNAGGFFDSRVIRQRGAGDLFVGTSVDAAVRAQRVSLTADAGSIRVTGNIDAGDGARARVSLAARDDVVVTGDIAASTNNADGGRVELLSQSGGVLVGPTSDIDVRGAAGASSGRVLIRSSREALNSVVDGNAANDRVTFGAQVLGAESVVFEGFRAYEATGGVIDSSSVAAVISNPWFADAQVFADSFDAIRQGLRLGTDPRVRIAVGVEVFSPNDLQVAADWNLFDWRFGAQPGFLTLRAGGNLLVDRSISDGFVTPTTFSLALPADARESWSYRLVGGADLASARPTGLLAFQDLLPDSGDVRIAAGRVSTNPMNPSDIRAIRTGTGDIDVLAARDFQLGNAASVVYTAGVAEPGVTLVGPGGLGIGNRFPGRGGNVSIQAERDVRGAPSAQLVTDWLWRTGRAAAGTDLGSATAWTVNFQRFLQNVGALAGGAVDVVAGRDIVDFSANIASIGRQVGGTRPADSVVQIDGGGLLNVAAGRDLLGGSYYVGAGAGAVRAFGSIGGQSELSQAPDPVLALGDARIEVNGRRGVQLASVVNPTLLRQGSSQPTTTLTRSVFSTYGETSGVSLLSSAGDVTMVNDPAALVARFTSMTFPENEPVAFRIYPPSLLATAARGDIEIQGTMSLYPAPGANVELFADGSVRAREVGPIEFLMSDADPALLPSVARPFGDLGYGLLADALGTALSVRRDLLSAQIPVHSDERILRAATTDFPVRFVARTGDVAMDTDNDASGFFLPKRVRVVAGRDVRDVTLVSQHVRPSDFTSLIAGRDIVYSSNRSDRGTLLGSLREIAVDGPGAVELVAGRNVDLRTSSGVSTRGDVQNPNLAPTGANVSVLTGIGAAPPRTATFLDRYVSQTARHDELLFAFVRAVSGQNVGDKAAALATLRSFESSQQQRFAQQVLFAELRSVGREAARTGSNDFRAAYAALEALFPGSNPEPNDRNAYAGDLSLFFSRIYTLDGGDISLLTPGGQINAGLATPPAAFGIRKEPSQLGVVAQSTGSIAALSFSDFQVNESRVFAADGGDILIWSTRGDIDAGRGAKTAISAPPPTVTIDENGRTVLRFPAALQGSGIQTLATSAGVRPGNVDLFAPRGVVNAGDAGIVAGNLTIAATAVLGANNIQVSGAAVGVPVSTSGLAAGLSNASSVASGSAQAATSTTDTNTRDRNSKSPLADQALGFLDVFLEGFGAEVCKPNDVECLKRNQR